MYDAGRAARRLETGEFGCSGGHSADRDLPVQKVIALMDVVQQCTFESRHRDARRNEIAMRRESTFWRNVGIVCLLHVGVIVGVARWSERAKNAKPADIVWMDGGALANVAAIAAATAVPSIQPEAVPTPIPQPTPTAPEETPPNSERRPASSVTGSKRNSANADRHAETHADSSHADALPKTDSETNAKAHSKEEEDANAETLSQRLTEEDCYAIGREGSRDTETQRNYAPESPAAATVQTGTPGSSGQGSGRGGASQFAAYANKLHDRFFSEWVEPTSVVATGAKMSALVRVRIEKDGGVSSFEIVRPSGNVVVDESVTAVRSYDQVDPLPGLGPAGHYDVKINFELNPEE